jgi:hypothetical protein
LRLVNRWIVIKAGPLSLQIICLLQPPTWRMFWV